MWLCGHVYRGGEGVRDEGAGAGESEGMKETLMVGGQTCRAGGCVSITATVVYDTCKRLFAQQDVTAGKSTSSVS